MLGSSDRYILTLSPERIVLVKMRAGTAKQCESVSLDPTQWRDHWHNGLRPLDQSLRQLSARFGEGTLKNVTLVYTSPGVVCRIDSFDEGEDASTTRMHAQLLQSTGATVPTTVQVLSTSKALGTPRSLTIGAADREEDLQKMYAWTRRSGLRVERMVPRTTEIMRQSAFHAAKIGGDGAVLYVDAAFSVIIANQDGVPVLARLTEIGYQSLVEVYTHHLSRTRQSEDGAEPVTHDALEHAFRDGIPLGAREDQSRAVLPLMAPVLQRFGVEVKQTFRFATSMSTPSSIMLCGPGSAIPGISAALEETLDMDVRVDPDASTFEPDRPLGKGAASYYIARKPEVCPSLLPRAALESKVRSSLTRSMKVGALLALVVLGGEYAATKQRSMVTQDRIEELDAKISSIDRERVEREEARFLASSVSTAATLLNARAGDAAPWGAVLAGVPGWTGPVRITEISGRLESGTPSLSLGGIVEADESSDRDANEIMSGYIRGLTEIRDVVRVEIERTSRVRTDEGRWGVSFELTLFLSSSTGELGTIAGIAAADQGVTP